MSIIEGLRYRLRPILRPIVRHLLYYFYETHYVVGSGGVLSIGRKVATANTVFNISSGSIYIGDFTIFGQNVLVLTGTHQFYDGRRAGIEDVIHGQAWGGGAAEVPSTGRNIRIGSGCFIASGAILTGGVVLGDNVIVASGAVVMKSFPDFSMIGGNPARLIGDTRDL